MVLGLSLTATSCAAPPDLDPAPPSTITSSPVAEEQLPTLPATPTDSSPGQPTLDPAAQAETVAGATLFAEYVMQVYSELYLTGDATTWNTLYSECGFCSDAATQAVEFWASEGSISIPTPPFIAVDNLRVTEPNGTDSAWVVTLEVTESDSLWRSSDGSESTHAGEVHPAWTLTMAYADGWSLVGVNPDGDPG